MSKKAILHKNLSEKSSDDLGRSLFITLFQKSILVRAAEDSGYIFPDSADRYMSTGELEGLTIQIINYGKMRFTQDMEGGFIVWMMISHMRLQLRMRMARFT